LKPTNGENVESIQGVIKTVTNKLVAWKKEKISCHKARKIAHTVDE